MVGPCKVHTSPAAAGFPLLWCSVVLHAVLEQSSMTGPALWLPILTSTELLYWLIGLAQYSVAGSDTIHVHVTLLIGQ